VLENSRQVELEHRQALDPKSTLITIVSRNSFYGVSKAYPKHQTKGMIEYARAIVCEPKISFHGVHLLTLVFFNGNNFGDCGLQYSHVSKSCGK